MSSLTGFFRSAPVESNGSEKLHDLYWNRAELKKEFAALRDEKYRLQDRIKQQEGVTARERQKNEHLENLLLDREWVHNVVVFYQMRRLGAHCHGKLERFAEQLKQQCEKRVHSKTMLSWNEKRARDVAVIESNLGQLRSQTQSLEDRLQSERHKLLTMSRFVRLFRGRRIEANRQDIETRLETSRKQEREFLAALDTLQNRCPPSHEGLSIAEKRTINFMILSFAQGLFLHFAEDDLSLLAKEASEKSVGAIRYGSRQDCNNLLELLNKRSDSSGELANLAEVLQKRAAKIADSAKFRSDDDVIPIPGTVATVYQIDANGVVRGRDGNLLGENYFEIAKVLSR